MATRLFLGGTSTKPDVDLLMGIETSIGSYVPYEKIEEITGLKYRTPRWHTVVSAWRKRLFRERHLQTKASDGAIHFLTADQALDEGDVKLTRVGRATGRLARDVSAIKTSELSSEERRQRHYLMAREANALLEAARTARKTVALPAPAPTRPILMVR